MENTEAEAGAAPASSEEPTTTVIETEPGLVLSAPREPLPDSIFGQIGQSLAIWALLGFAVVMWFRLTFLSAWVTPFLQKNTLLMAPRLFLLTEMLAGGAVFAGAAGVFLYLRRNRLMSAAALVERWGWFLSPLILLPAIPVMTSHKVWLGDHKTLLPIVLFCAIIAEFLFARAARFAPSTSELGLDDIKLPAFRGREFLKKHFFLILIVTLGVAYGAFMSFYTIRWHHRLGTAIFDLGINNNLIHGGLHGKINYSTVIFPDSPIKYWANHVKLGLFLFLPFYALVPRAETLLVIQSVSLGLGAIPLFLFARRRLPELFAFVIAVAYLCYYPMHSANFFEMKEPPTAAAFVLTMIWAFEAKHWRTAWVFFFISLIMREDMPIPLVMIGVVYLFSSHRPRSGIAMAVIAGIWFIVLRFKIMNDAGAWWFPNMYESLWSQPEKGFRSVIKTLLTNPTFVLKHFFVEKKFWYLMHLMVPVAFLPGRRWYLWAAFVPGAILTLLVTDYDPPIMFTFQYVMHWGPYLFLASILAIEALRKEENFGKARAFGAVAALAVASLSLTYNYGAFTLRDRAVESGYHKIRFSWGPTEEKIYRDVLAIAAKIPKTASVAATEHLGAHVAARSTFFTLRRGHHNADYILFQRSELRLDKTKDAVKDALTSKKYGEFARVGSLILLKRGANPEKNEDLIREQGLGPKTRAARLQGPASPDPVEPKKDDAEHEPEPENDAPSSGGD